MITNIGFMKQQMNYSPDEYSAVEIYLTKDQDQNSFATSLQKKLGNKFKVLTKFEQNTSLYQSMRLEKWFVYAVLTLILIIAAFNIVGALTMLVLEKRKDISVLMALGADKNMIRKNSSERAMVVPRAAPATPIFGKPKLPKIKR